MAGCCWKYSATSKDSNCSAQWLLVNGSPVSNRDQTQFVLLDVKFVNNAIIANP
jgi:hypothetical protein